MASYPVPEELERALDRWMEQLREPPPDRATALVWALQDFLMGVGIIPYDEEPEGSDSPMG